MWHQEKLKLDKLKSMDKTMEIFGAQSHRYRLNPVVTKEEIETVEEKLNVALPLELKQFYLEIGNGVAGPNYGLKSLSRLIVFQPDKPFPGVEYLKKIAQEEEEFSQEDYFEVNHEEIQGLIAIIEEGCGHQTCLVTAGENVGKVVYVSGDGFVQESQDTLLTIYHQWLDKNILAFEEIKKLLDADISMEEIYLHIQEKLNRYDGKDLAISLMGVEKPAELFGSGGTKIYHGASQDPWYEEQISMYRSKRISGF